MAVPPELSALFDGSDPASREEAWAAFVDRYSSDLLRSARKFGREYDDAMDRYRFILESLRKDDFRRVRSYQARGRSSFRSWLAVVARRLCLDYERSRYGRGGRAADVEASDHERAMRRRLVDLAGAVLDPAWLPEPTGENPERRLRETELKGALDAALGELDPRDRLLVRLRFEDGLTVRQIADVMRFPSVFHVYRRLNPLLEGIRSSLQARGFGEPTP